VETRGVKDLRSMPWWTPADRAELNVITRELVDAVFPHRERCQVCLLGLRPCPQVQRAITLVIEWREARILLSRALWERSRQSLAEFELELDELLLGLERAS
jgi:hypothetical protein